MNIIKVRGDRNLRSLIDTERGTVSRELYINDDIFEQELEQIYGRCWLFLGHESQLPNPGDFVVTRMGTEEVLLIRDRKDKQVRAFLNSCAHRGMKVCRYDQGNALVFTCPFHAWTYDTAGRLVGAAYQDDPRAYAGSSTRSSGGCLRWPSSKTTTGHCGQLGTPRRLPLRITWGPSPRVSATTVKPVTARRRASRCLHPSRSGAFPRTGRSLPFPRRPT